MSDLISVIVPVYNAKNYIGKCIKSICNQTYKNLEIILIDDKSTDGSLSLLREYESKDLRIKVINKEFNEGVDLARHTGIANAKGKYITFVDADDWLNKDFIVTLYDTLQSNKVDIVASCPKRWFSKKLRINKSGCFDSSFVCRVIDGKLKDDLFVSYFGCNIYPVNMWGNLYKADLFEKELFASRLKFGEDLIMSLQLYHRAKSVYMTDFVGYNYRWGGVTSRYNSKLWEDTRYLLNYKLDILDKMDFPEADRFQAIEVKNYIWTVITSLVYYKVKEKQEIVEWLQNEFRDKLFDKAFSRLPKEYINQQVGYSRAIYALDAKETVEYACQQYKKDKIKFEFKQFVGKAIKVFHL